MTTPGSPPLGLPMGWEGTMDELPPAGTGTLSGNVTGREAEGRTFPAGRFIGGLIEDPGGTGAAGGRTLPV